MDWTEIGRDSGAMTSVTDPAEATRIIKLVQGALDRRQPRNYRVHLQPDGVLQDDGWYQVVVVADSDVRTYDFYDVLAETEAELQDQHHLNVLLVPAVGE